MFYVVNVHTVFSTEVCVCVFTPCLRPAVHTSPKLSFVTYQTALPLSAALHISFLPETALLCATPHYLHQRLGTNIQVLKAVRFKRHRKERTAISLLRPKIPAIYFMYIKRKIVPAQAVRAYGGSTNTAPHIHPPYTRW